MIIITVIVIISLAMAGQAVADWQYTRWNMTPDQVIASSNGAAILCKDKDCEGYGAKNCKALVQGTYQSGEFTFKAYFSFGKTSNQLCEVELKLLNSAQMHDLKDAMHAKYGEPEKYIPSSVFDRFVWRNTVDEIDLLGIGRRRDLYIIKYEHVSIRYRPRVDESNKGL